MEDTTGKEKRESEKRIGADWENCGKTIDPDGNCAAVHRYRRIQRIKRADDDTQNRGDETNI
ncbi:MAG: hypothetical protein K2P00_05865, partial [Alistipes sp.]|nr:hypothetical protein [Alistipes sp.]